MTHPNGNEAYNWLMLFLDASRLDAIFVWMRFLVNSTNPFRILEIFLVLQSLTELCKPSYVQRRL